VRPDLLCLGKGLTGGYLPMSATVASQVVYDAFLGEDLSERTFYHGHSYSGNALAAAVALRHLQLIDEWSVLENVRARSEQLAKALDGRVAAKPAVAAVPAGALFDEGTRKPVVSFASNDYLGLTQHGAVIAAAHAALDRWGAGSGAARLIVGSRPIHSELEHELARWKGTERALLFPTG